MHFLFSFLAGLFKKKDPNPSVIEMLYARICDAERLLDKQQLTDGMSLPAVLTQYNNRMNHVSARILMIEAELASIKEVVRTSRRKRKSR